MEVKAQRLANKGKLPVKLNEINQFDGLIHLANGERTFPDGTVVDGSNDGVGYLALHDEDISFNPSLSEIDQKEREMKEVRAQIAMNEKARAQKEAQEAFQQKEAAKEKTFNEFDGLYHNADGTRTFVNGVQLHGVNTRQSV